MPDAPSPRPGLELLDAAGRGLRLTVEGYELPDRVPGPEGYDHDANWLVVRLELTDRQWRTELSIPCLTTTEARELVAWLRAAADGRAQARVDFLEPVLAFRLGRQAGGTAQLRIEVEETTATSDLGQHLDLVVPSTTLRAAAAAWEDHLAAFPER